MVISGLPNNLNGPDRTIGQTKMSENHEESSHSEGFLSPINLITRAIKLELVKHTN